MEIPESPTRGAEQLGTVITQLSLIRLYCKFVLMHIGGSYQRKCISVKGMTFAKLKFYCYKAVRQNATRESYYTGMVSAACEALQAKYEHCDTESKN